jgi:hypothetical protein
LLTRKRVCLRKKVNNFYVYFLAVLSESPPSFTITVTSEAGENDESKSFDRYLGFF